MTTTNAGATDKSSSEATGYGMILAALMAGNTGEPDTREYFDGFYRLYDRNRSGTNNVLMSFTVGQNTLIGQIGPAHSPNTGLMPDFVVENPPRAAPPRFLEKDTDGDYSWNACRFPLRIAVDFAHTGAPESKAALARISKWVAGATAGNPAMIRAGYKLDGTPLVTYGNMAFTAPLIASAIADATNQAFLNQGWGYLASIKQNEYYGDSIALLTLLLLSGNWWPPDEQLPVRLGDRGLREKAEDGSRKRTAIGIAARRTAGADAGGPEAASLDGRKAGPDRPRAAGAYVQRP